METASLLALPITLLLIGVFVKIRRSGWKSAIAKVISMETVNGKIELSYQFEVEAKVYEGKIYSEFPYSQISIIYDPNNPRRNEEMGSGAGCIIIISLASISLFLFNKFL